MHMRPPSLMFKVPKQSYTAEFKVAAVQRVKDGQGFAVVARELGMSEQMELSRMRAEIKRLQMELEIAKKAAAYFAKDLL